MIPSPPPSTLPDASASNNVQDSLRSQSQTMIVQPPVPPDASSSNNVRTSSRSELQTQMPSTQSTNSVLLESSEGPILVAHAPDASASYSAPNAQQQQQQQQQRQRSPQPPTPSDAISNNNVLTSSRSESQTRMWSPQPLASTDPRSVNNNAPETQQTWSPEPPTPPDARSAASSNAHEAQQMWSPQPPTPPDASSWRSQLRPQPPTPIEAQQQEYYAGDEYETQPMLPFHEYPHSPQDVQKLENFQRNYSAKSVDYSDSQQMAEFLEPALTQDAYSFLYTANFCSPAFCFALMIVGLQLILMCLLFFNVYDTSGDPNTTNGVENRLRMPAGVEYTVTFAQFLALVLTVVIMANGGNAIKGLSHFVEGYEADIRKKSPNATCFRWFMSGFLQTMNGFMFLVLSFILTMQTTTVISLILNLTALILLQQIDVWGFQMASSGLLGTRARTECEHVMGIRQLIPEDSKKRILYSKRALVIVLFISVFVPYVILANEQANGKYVSTTVYVQMGDGFSPQYAYYSGLFEKQPSKFLVEERRPNYADATKTLELSWCSAVEGWTISYTNTSSCNYIFRSSATPSFDVLDTDGGDWFVNTNTRRLLMRDLEGNNAFFGSLVDTIPSKQYIGGDDNNPIHHTKSQHEDQGARRAQQQAQIRGFGDYPVDWIKVFGNDCSKNRDLCNGQCVDNRCVVEEPGWRGLNNEFPPSTCDFFSVDQTTTSSLSAVSGASFFGNNYFYPLLPESDVMLYDRLIYTDVNSVGNSSVADSLVRNILLFSGRRWVIYGLPPGAETTLTYDELVQFMKDNENQNDVATLQNIASESLDSGHVPLFFSSPVDYGTDTYSVEPSAVTWFRAEEWASDPILGYRADETRPVDVKLHCAACDDATNPCQNGGVCKDGSCLCPVFFAGFMCEYAIGCVEIGSSCFYNHTCNSFSNICNCGPGYSGNLCQYGPDLRTEDPFFCESFSCEGGNCNCMFAPTPIPTLAPTASPSSSNPPTMRVVDTSAPTTNAPIAPGTTVPTIAPETAVPTSAPTCPPCPVIENRNGTLVTVTVVPRSCDGYEKFMANATEAPPLLQARAANTTAPDTRSPTNTLTGIPSTGTPTPLWTSPAPTNPPTPPPFDTTATPSTMDPTTIPTTNTPQAAVPVVTTGTPSFGTPTTITITNSARASATANDRSVPFDFAKYTSAAPGG